MEGYARLSLVLSKSNLQRDAVRSDTHGLAHLAHKLGSCMCERCCLAGAALAEPTWWHSTTQVLGGGGGRWQFSITLV